MSALAKIAQAALERLSEVLDQVLLEIAGRVKIRDSWIKSSSPLMCWFQNGRPSFRTRRSKPGCSSSLRRPRFTSSTRRSCSLVRGCCYERSSDTLLYLARGFHSRMPSPPAASCCTSASPSSVSEEVRPSSWLRHASFTATPPCPPSAGTRHDGTKHLLIGRQLVASLQQEVEARLLADAAGGGGGSGSSTAGAASASAAFESPVDTLGPALTTPRSAAAAAAAAATLSLSLLPGFEELRSRGFR